MNIDRIKNQLAETGRHMIDLSERLGQKGKPLDKWEKDIVRAGMIPAVKERLDIMLLEYLTGSHNPVLEEFDVD